MEYYYFTIIVDYDVNNVIIETMSIINNEISKYNMTIVDKQLRVLGVNKLRKQMRQLCQKLYPAIPMQLVS